jgi:hypothetical protein
MMGINHAADKWKWLAIHIMEGPLPKFDTLLIKLVQAVDPDAIRSLVSKTEDVIPVLNAVAVLSLMLFIIFFVTFICLYISIEQRMQSFHWDYVRLQYGGTVETMARTYANLMKFHCNRVRRNGIGIGAERTKIFLIGAGETAEAYLRYDREFSSDEILQSFLPQGQPFVFRTIKEALHTLDVCCTSEKKLPKTLFVLILISTRDPSQGAHEHETFQMPSSLRDHCYAIVGTEMGASGISAHKLSKTAKGPNGELLRKSLPLGPENSGVSF